MKKKIIIILSIWVILSTIFGICYKKYGPKPLVPQISAINSRARAAKEPFKTIGMAAAQTSLKRKKPILAPFAKEMREFGAENISLQIEKNSSPVSKTLPPVVIGGKTHKYKTICAIVSYDYKGKRYEVGTCK